MCRKGTGGLLIAWSAQDIMKNEELPMLISLGIRDVYFLTLREAGMGLIGIERMQSGPREGAWAPCAWLCGGRVLTSGGELGSQVPVPAGPVLMSSRPVSGLVSLLG